ncbi:MAG: tetratricopeptide repeat protein [Planctomycetes bacterium]|nr:tetratricopeptide repeat protein [Planctomycetota bacterium]
MPTVQDERVAELVVQRRLLTPAQVSECQQLQSQSQTPCTLAQVIVSRRYATPEALRALTLGPGQTHASSSHGSALPSGQAPAARRATGTFPAGGPAGSDDREVAFARFLMGEGAITADQAREAYKLLTGYREQFPQVNLSQVLAKHGMCDKEVLRAAYARFVEGGAGAPSSGPPAGAQVGSPVKSSGAYPRRHDSEAVTLDGPSPLAPAGGGWGAPASGAEPRFGFKTVELDPQERPDFPPKAPPVGSAMFSPFAAQGGALGPPVDPGALDDFLPVDSSPQGAAPRFVESETIVDRPRADGGGLAARMANARGPGATAGESRWTAETGPRGTHAGPGGTHRHRGFGTDAGSALLPPAQPVQLPPPLQLAPDLGEDDAEDDADEGAEGGGDTNIQSTSLGGARPKAKSKAGRRAAAPAAARSGPPMAVVAGAAGAVVIGLIFGMWMFAQRMELRNAKREFLAAVGAEPPAVSLKRRETLPARLLEDPEVAAELKKLQEAVDRLDARAAAEKELARLASAASPDERLAICDRALAADSTYALAHVARGRVRLTLLRKAALEKGTQVKTVDLVGQAMIDIDQALSVEPTSAPAYLAKAQLYMLLANDPDARQRAQSSLQNVTSQDAGSPLATLAQGMIEALKRDLEKAIEHYNRAIAADPKLVEAYLARAEARLRRREYPAALTDASAAVRMEPTSSLALTLQAEARYFATRDATNRSGDRTGALSDLDQALKLDPANGRALAMRAYARLERDRIGDVLSTDDEMEQAHRDASRAVLADPEQALAHVALAEIASGRRNPRESLTHAAKGVEYGRHMPLVYLVRGRLRARDGDEQAVQDFDEVLRLDPGNPRALTNKAAVLITRLEFDNARAYLDNAISSDPELAEAFFHRGLIHLKSRPRQYQPAIDDLSRAIELKAQFSDAYFYRAVAFSYQNQWDQCIDDLKKAEAQRRDDTRGFHVRDLYLLRGHCHYQKKEWREAQTAYLEFQKLAPPGQEVMKKVLERLEKIRGALAGEAIEVDPEDSGMLGR